MYVLATYIVVKLLLMVRHSLKAIDYVIRRYNSNVSGAMYKERNIGLKEFLQFIFELSTSFH